MKQWYCMKGGNEYGPIPEDDFVMMFLSAQLDPGRGVSGAGRREMDAVGKEGGRR
jgi:hypothetical protein